MLAFILYLLISSSRTVALNYDLQRVQNIDVPLKNCKLAKVDCISDLRTILQPLLDSLDSMLKIQNVNRICEEVFSPSLITDDLFIDAIDEYISIVISRTYSSVT